MKKTLIKWQWMYTFVAMAMLMACQQDVTVADLNPETSKQMDVIVTASQGSEVDSRISYTPQEETTGTTVVVKWEGKSEEMIAYSWYDAEGVHLGYLPAIENSVSSDGKSQNFGGTLNMNDGVNGTWHHLFYPLPWDSWITQDDTEKTLTIRYPMNNQVQDCTEGNETKHLEAYNIMNVMNSQLETGTATISFKHYTSLLYMDLTLPESNTISSIKLVSEQAMFGTEYIMKFILIEAGLGQGTEDDKMSTSVTLTLQNDAEDTSVKGYLMLTPYYVKENESATFHVEATATDGTVYKSEDITVSATGYLFKAGKCKTLRRTLEKVVLPMGDKTAEQAVKGDLAMADGTFISKDDIANLTDEQKANVRGVVFWTEENDKVYTYSSLAYDEIMKTDFPTCTHGLIVALNNVATGCKWQDPNASVVAWQTNIFSDANKSDYKQIAAINGETDNLKYILGYQNTKLLKAYNKYCSETTGMSDYIVKPVAELVTWESTPGNEAPANTTGWFIPSAKELHMLCYKDVLYNSLGTTTYKAINPLIEALGGTELGETESGGAELSDKKNYWSSTERRDDTGFAYQIYFNDGSFSRNAKYGLAYIRAVCAF